jgi:lipopolysaccharide export system protein LptC
MIRQLLWFLLIILACAWLYSFLLPQEQNNAPKTEQQLQPDFIAYDLTRTSFDAQGLPADQIKAQQMSHFEVLGLTQFEQPAFVLFDQQQARWHIQAQQAINYSGDRLVLTDNVVVDNLLPNEFFQQLTTSEFELLYDSQWLQTDKLVQVQGDGFTMNGEGMKFQLATQQLQLKKHIGTTYHHEK